MPPRTKLSPIEDVSELEKLLCEVLHPVSNEARIHTALSLIQFTGELSVKLEPLQIVDKAQRPLNSRPILLEHNQIAKAVLRALQQVSRL